MLDLRFTRCKTDHYIDAKWDGEGIIGVNVYVDDLVLACNDDKMPQMTKEAMYKQFEMTDLGLPNYFLVIEIDQDAISCKLSDRQASLPQIYWRSSA